MRENGVKGWKSRQPKCQLRQPQTQTTRHSREPRNSKASRCLWSQWLRERNQTLIQSRQVTSAWLVRRFDLAVRRQAGKQKGLGSIRLSLFFKKVAGCGYCLVTLSLTINETLKWLSSLLILMQVILVVTAQRYVSDLPLPTTSIGPSLISLMASVDVKHEERQKERVLGWGEAAGSACGKDRTCSK